MPRDWLEARVCSGIAGLYGIARDQVTPEASLVNLGTDSLRATELLLWLDGQLGFFEAEGLDDVETVRDNMDVVRRHL